MKPPFSWNLARAGLCAVAFLSLASLTLAQTITWSEYTLATLNVRDRAANVMANFESEFTALNPPPFPPPLVTVRFNEGAGTTAANSGSLGGTLGLSTPVPVWSANGPGNAGGGSSVDFGTTTGNYYVESPAPYAQLAGLTQFTISGWVNNRSSTIGSGGNRIVTWNSPNSDGVDLVYLSDGSLRIGINQWPDASGGGGPISSVSQIPTDANAGLDNWRFFAVTYDSTLAGGQVKFYFGSIVADAAFDVERTYARGAVGSNIKPLVIGHFNNTTRPNALDRMFRGLIDEVQVFNEALTGEEIVAVQRANDVVTPLAFVSEPVDQAVVAGHDATFSVMVTGGFPISYQWQRDNSDISGATGASYTVAGPMPPDDGAQFRVIVTNPLGQLVSSNATLRVSTDTTPPTVVAVETTRDLTTLRIVFSEPVDLNTATDEFNYGVLFEGNALGTISVELQPNLTDVLLTTDPMTPGALHTLMILNIRDRALPPNTMADFELEFTAYDPPPRTDPLIEVRFEEGPGSTAANTGTVGGTGTIDFGLASSAAGLPAFTNNVPTGPYAPGGNQYSLYTGTGAGHAQYAGKALDFPYAVKSSTLGLEQFTVSGWINLTDGTIGGGGNRIIGTWPNNSGGVTSNQLTGFDVVVTANGTMRLGVNQAPDYPTPPGNIGPTSSTGKVSANAAADPANWVFFAITYDTTLGSEHVQFYFGNANTPAAKDTAATLVNYNRGAIADASVQRNLSLVNFIAGTPSDGTLRDSTSNSRAFRGLMDEIRFFANALTLDEIQEVQTRGAEVITAPAGISGQPVSQTVFAGQPATFGILVTGTPPVAVQWQRDGSDIPGATSVSYSLIPGVADDGALFRAAVSNEFGTDLSVEAALTVLPEDGYKAHLPLNEAEGSVTTNLGNLGGDGTFTLQAGFPVFSSSVPVGSYAPAGNVSSVDFGTIVAVEDGNRSIDFTNAWDNTLGQMEALTVSGWVNSRDLTTGSGGNRIAFALDAPNGRGFDLVQLANGALQLGINQWPDYSSATSSVSRVTSDPDVGPDNWVFFAVTYDPALTDGHAKFYFGGPEAPAEFDVARDYNRGPLVVTGPLTLGNFGLTATSVRVATGPGGSGSRVFRGLMDELSVFNRTLTLDEIRRVQQGLPPVVPGPVLTIVREGAEAVITWTSTATFELVYKDQLGAGVWTPVSETVTSAGNLHSVRVTADQPTRFYLLR